MYETISNDIKNAMKAKDKIRLDALRMLKSRLMENRTAKAPVPEMDVLVGHYKKLNESIEMFPEGSEQRVKIVKELEIIAEYMPQPLNDEEVKAIIKSIISQDASANFGMVMRSLTPQIKGKYDGKKASQLVKEILGT